MKNSNYRFISNLSVICKITEGVVKSRLTEHLYNNNLLNLYQSASCKHHSTETALLYIHNYLINAVGSQKYHVAVFLISLLNLTLLTITSYCLVFPRGLEYLTLSSAGSSLICPIVLSVLNSKIGFVLSVPVLAVFHTRLWSSLPSFCHVGYTAPLSSLISFLFLNHHHLYAYDIQVFFSFHSSDIHSSITYLHCALQQISFWMTSNLFTLNF